MTADLLERGRITTIDPERLIVPEKQRSEVAAREQAQQYSDGCDQVVKAAAFITSDPYRYFDSNKYFPIGVYSILRSFTGYTENWIKENRNIDAMLEMFRKIYSPAEGIGNAEKSVFACLCAKKQNGKIHRKLLKLYEQFKDRCCGYMDDPLLSRDTVWFDLTIEEQDVYRKTFCMLMKADEDRELESRLFMILRQYDPDYTERIRDPGDPHDRLTFIPKEGGDNILKLMAYATAKQIQNEKNCEAQLWVMLFTKYAMLYYDSMEDLSFTGIYSEYYIALHSVIKPVISRKGAEECFSYMLHIVKAAKGDEEGNMEYIFRSIYSNICDLSDSRIRSARVLLSMDLKTIQDLLYKYANWSFYTYRMRGRFMDENSYIRDVRKGAGQIFGSLNPDKDVKVDVDNAYADSWGKFYDFVSYICRIQGLAELENRIRFAEQKAQKNEAEAGELRKQLREVKADSLAAENLRLQQQVKSLANDLKAARSDMHDSEEKVRQLQSELADRREDQQELIQLREIVFSMENDMEPETAAPDAEDISRIAKFLDSRRGAFLGGHDTFHQRIQKYLPSWKIYKPEKTISRQDARSLDIIVACTNHMDHASFEGTRENIRQLPVDFIMIGQTNIEKVLNIIYNEYIRQEQQKGEKP